jgi:hypothetical protein
VTGQTNGQPNLAERAALSLIAADARLFLDLVYSPRLEPIRPTAILMLMPFSSAFLYESIGYLKRGNPEALPELRPHRELLRASRMRMKLLDGDPRTLETILTEADESVAIVKDMFMRDHRGVLGLLNRLRQKDVGIHFVRKEIVGTIHAGLLNTGVSNRILSGLSLDTLGVFLRDSAVDFGKEACQLLDDLGIFDELAIKARVPEDGSEPPLSPPEHLDLKSEHFYGAMARPTATDRNGIGVLLTWILSQVNTARVLVPLVAGDNEVAAFKVKFVTLFHAATSLQWLLGKHLGHGRFLRADAEEQIRDMLGARAVRSVRKKEALRHNLVHYGVEECYAPRLSSSLPLFGLVEALTSGQSLAAVAEDVRLGLDGVSEGLTSLLPNHSRPRVRCEPAARQR